MLKAGYVQTMILGICITLAGISVGYGFFKGRTNDRYVTVKGLAEREVEADLAIWPITFNAADDHLLSLQDQINKTRKTITTFLTEAGFKEGQISYSSPRITDTRANRGYNGPNVSQYRYIAQATVTVRTEDVPLVKKSMENSGELIGQGVVLASESWETPTEFIFTSLNDIKPEMIEEATKDARKAAEKFALDSGSQVGKIRHATQGYFSIFNRDNNSPEIKKIRVVTTVEYFLVD